LIRKIPNSSTRSIFAAAETGPASVPGSADAVKADVTEGKEAKRKKEEMETAAAMAEAAAVVETTAEATAVEAVAEAEAEAVAAGVEAAVVADDSLEKSLARNHLKPAWKGNIIIIGSLILLVLAYYYWQIRESERTFIAHVEEHTRLIADVIKLNAVRAMLSQEIVEEIIGTFLGNSARFVDYLDAIEPFSSDELTAFALESGLSAIRIARPDGTITEGPVNGFRIEAPCNSNNHTLQHTESQNIYFQTIPRASGAGCIAVGLADARIETLNVQISLPYLLNLLSDLPGIQYVRLEKLSDNTGKFNPLPEINIAGDGPDKIAEARLPLEGGILHIGLKARHFYIRVKHLRGEFMGFSVIIAVLGICFSWALYRYQAAYIAQVRNFERRLAREKEDASLGRASAAITHEIRNPLNAISMGLQRLEIEAGELTEDHRAMISILRKAVQRTDGIIAELRRYARPLAVKRDPVHPDTLIRSILKLYQEPCASASVSVTYTSAYAGTISADPQLLEEIMENLIKNAIEAQPEGGYLSVELFPEERNVILSVENSGFRLPEAEAERILEPYFTTKTRGSGLGLSIVRRIVRGHDGEITVQVPKPGILRISITLPIKSAQ
jgi:signal transduction histidine kinase